MGDMAQETILVIANDAYSEKTLQQTILLPLGYQVLRATNGPAGLQMSHDLHPDAIMLDMDLASMTGLEVLILLRERNCQTPIIFMTRHGSESLAVEVFRLGVSDYLIKPFIPNDVQQAIRRALQKTAPPERIEYNLIAAKTVQQTAVTLSHYINNHLMALTGGLSLLQETLQKESPNQPLLSKILADGQVSLDRIEKVMRVLQQITDVRPIPYCDEIYMIDVESALREELGREYN